MNKRRNAVVALSAVLFAPKAVFAQAKKRAVMIGWLHSASRQSNIGHLSAFREGLAALGYKEGEQFVIEERWADGRIERLLPFAEELAARKPALIVATPSPAVAAAAKAAPTTPVVQGNGGDPVETGLVKSLARPGGMITGLSNSVDQIEQKYVELLLIAAPKSRRLGVLADSVVAAPASRARNIEAIRRWAAQNAVEVRFEEAATPEEIEPALARLAKQDAQALAVFPSAMLGTQSPRVARLAFAQGWPLIGSSTRAPESGWLLSYSADSRNNFRRAAYYVDRILKGANPGDLPIEQPTTFEFVVNLKTDKALGLTMPPEIMVRATRVIE